MLLGIASTIQSTRAAQELMIGNGLAQMLMDEIAGKKYTEDLSQPYQYPFSANNNELVGPGWSRFNDIDDFINIRSSPPKDSWNVPLGNDDGRGGSRHPNFRVGDFLSKWRQEIDVYYVNANNLTQRLTGSQTSPYRAVEVRIYVDDANGGRRLVSNLRRVFAYVPGG